MFFFLSNAQLYCPVIHRFDVALTSFDTIYAHRIRIWWLYFAIPPDTFTQIRNGISLFDFVAMHFLSLSISCFQCKQNGVFIETNNNRTRQNNGIFTAHFIHVLYTVWLTFIWSTHTDLHTLMCNKTHNLDRNLNAEQTVCILGEKYEKMNNKSWNKTTTTTRA